MMKYIIGNIEVTVEPDTRNVILYDLNNDNEVVISAMYFDLMVSAVDDLQEYTASNADISVAEVKQKRQQLELSIDAAIQNLVDRFTNETGVTVENIDLTSYEIQNLSHEKYGQCIYTSKIDLRI